MADRVRRVSFLVDLGAGTAEERAQVRLVLSRVLTHLSRQSPAPPRWSFRFYDSSLTPQRFDARMHARAKASSAVDPKLGAAASLELAPGGESAAAALGPAGAATEVDGALGGLVVVTGYAVACGPLPTA